MHGSFTILSFISCEVRNNGAEREEEEASSKATTNFERSTGVVVDFPGEEKDLIVFEKLRRLPRTFQPSPKLMVVSDEWERIEKCGAIVSSSCRDCQIEP